MRLVHSDLSTGIHKFRAQTLQMNSYIVEYTNLHVKIIRSSQELNPCPAENVWIQEENTGLFSFLSMFLFTHHI